MPDTKICSLSIKSFRNLSHVNLAPSLRFNLIYGLNGSGKTSLLEAIYYLGVGKSFRSHISHRMIQRGDSAFQIIAELSSENSCFVTGVERRQDGSRLLRFNGDAISSIAVVAKHLPLLFLSTESHRYFSDGPKQRRQYLDWGVFHVEQAFFPAWQSIQLLLQQRNAALKSQLTLSEISLWDEQMVPLATSVDRYRTSYVEMLQPLFNQLLSQLLPSIELKLRYYRGWSGDKTFEEVLKHSIQKDRQYGYTQFGPHRADMQLYANNNTPAQDALSQGQQKLASYAIHLAQGLLLQKSTGINPVYLIDDLPSDLDPNKRVLIIDILRTLPSQVFITGITREDLGELLSLEDTCLFHVEHGNVVDEYLEHQHQT